MGKIVVTEFITLDGVIEDPGGGETFEHGGWSFKFDRGPEGDAFKLEELQAADAQLLGRRTYEHFAAAWPNMVGDEFGAKMNEMPKYVVSSTLTDASWTNSTVIGINLAAEIPALKERHQGDILIAGSAQLVQGLTTLGLVDEYRLMVFPVVLGSGKRLFGDLDQPRTLKLTKTQTAGASVILTLQPAG